MAKGINIRFPFKDTVNGGVFDVNKTTDRALKDDLISLLTTKRGHRPMRNELYSPVYDYIMEPLDDFLKKELKSELDEKIEQFLPQITLIDVLFSEDDGGNFLTLEIIFEIKSYLGTQDSIKLNIPKNETNIS
jgi:phage baseplate assembly protein W